MRFQRRPIPFPESCSAVRFTADEERNLAGRAAARLEDGKPTDDAIVARNLLAQSMLRWGVSVAGTVANKYGFVAHEEFEDCVSVGMQAIMRAVSQFDPDRGRLTTLVATAVRRSVQRHLIEEWRHRQRCEPLCDVHSENMADRHDRVAETDAKLDTKELMRRLPKRLQQIVTMRQNGALVDEVAAEFDVSGTRIKQLYNRALALLRKRSEPDTVSGNSYC